MLSKSEAFQIAYGRDIDDHYIAYIQEHASPDAKTAAGQLRAVIACLDRQEIASPITVRFNADDLYVADLDGFRMYLDRVDESVSTPIGVHGNYEPHLCGFFRKLVKSGMTAVDIGGNVGFYSMLFASLVGDAGKVLTFEPNTENCRLILLSTKLNEFKNVDLYPFALDDKMGALYFTPAVGSNGLILPKHHETLLDSNCIVVPAMRLDDLPIDTTVNFMKLDIEGAEYRALRGAERVIREARPVITAEFSLHMLSRTSGISGKEFLEWIRSQGYLSYLIRRSDATLEPVGDVDAFLAGWGDNFYRIEDFAHIPAEMDVSPW